MAAIRLVRQEDSGGCGLACVAMVAGKSYAEIREWWVRECQGDLSRITNGGRGITTYELGELIEKLRVPGVNVVDGFGPTIRIITAPTGGPGHFIVIDGHGQVHNPG